MTELAKRLREAANWRLDDLGTDGAREVASLLTEAAAALSAQSDAKLTRSEIEDLKNEICPENGWIEKEIPRFHALCDMALSALSGVRVPVEMLENLVVRYRDNCNYCHGQKRELQLCLANEADKLLAAAKGGAMKAFEEWLKDEYGDYAHTLDRNDVACMKDAWQAALRHAAEVCMAECEPEAGMMPPALIERVMAQDTAHVELTIIAAVRSTKKNIAATLTREAGGE